MTRSSRRSAVVPPTRSNLLRADRRLAFLAAASATFVVLAGCSEGSSREVVNAAPSDGTTTASSSEGAAAGPAPDLIMDVDIDGRRVHVTCFGPIESSVPTLLFEAGAGSPSDTWDGVVDALSTTRRTCAYDRAGTGASPLPAQPRRTMTDVVADLEAVLDKAEITGPFVLIGHSMAVWPESLYAARHPDEVAGVVLVDPRGPHVSDRFRAALLPARAGEPKAVTTWREEDLGVFEHDPALNPEHLDLTRSAEQASRVLDAPGPLFGDAPLVVLSAAESDAPFSDLPPAVAQLFQTIWLEEQRSLVEESTHGSFQVVQGSRHEIQLEQPQAVVEAIETVLAAVPTDLEGSS